MTSSLFKSPPAVADPSGTRERLLDAAGRVFAERGFAAATVREICSLAGANVAAINYHFGDKEGLYSRVLGHALDIARDRHPINDDPGAPAEDRLRAFIGSFLMRMLDDGRPAWHGKLMAREMVEPTKELEVIARTTMRPTFDLLLGIIAGLTGLRADGEIARRCAFSVIGQCVMHKHCRPAIEVLYPGARYDGEAISALANHIHAFSLAGVRAAAARGEGTPCTVSP
jgi:AcrR family transcriptional regulator